MKRSSAWVIALLLSGCRTRGLDPGSNAVSSSADCDGPQTQPGVEIIACGFGPEIAVVGTDDEAVFVVTGGGAIYRIDKATGKKNKLYTLKGSGTYSLDSLAKGVRLAGGMIYFVESLETGPWAIVAINASTPTLGATRVIESTNIPQSSEWPILVDDQRVYWVSERFTGNGASTGPWMSVSLGGGDAQALAGNDSAEGPIALDAGYLYSLFTRSPHTLGRVSTSGGAVETVIAQIDPLIAIEGIAVRDDHLYGIKTIDSSNQEIVRHAFAGAGLEVLTHISSAGEVPLGLLRDLVVDADFVYALEGFGARFGNDRLIRIPVNGTQQPPTEIVSAIAPPVFDAASLYFTYVRGGGDTPIEGVVARRAK